MTRVIAAKMLERELEDHVRAYLRDLGLWGFHPYDARRSEKGFPDWMIVGNRVIFRELKTEHGSLTPEQRMVGSKLQRAGQSWAVWRPRDLVSGVILRQLEEISAAQGAIF